MRASCNLFFISSSPSSICPFIFTRAFFAFLAATSRSSFSRSEVSACSFQTIKFFTQLVISFISHDQLLFKVLAFILEGAHSCPLFSDEINPLFPIRARSIIGMNITRPLQISHSWPMIFIKTRRILKPIFFYIQNKAFALGI